MNETFGAGGLCRFLQNAKREIQSGLKQHVVMGNESADLDSMVSALVYAYFLDHGSRSPDVNYLPLINMESSHFHSRPEAVHALSLAGIGMENLAFRDIIDLDALQSEVRLQLTLVDHNELALSQAHLKNTVVGIIDHHADEGQLRDIAHRVIEPVGSCAALVAGFVLDGAPELVDDVLAKLLLGPILLDTVDLDPSKGRCCEKDISTAARLLQIAPIPTTDWFRELMEKRADVASLNPYELMMRDFKRYKANGFMVGISVIPMKIRTWLSQNPDAFSRILEFASHWKLDLYLIMAYHVNKDLGRELIAFSTQKSLLSRAYTSLLRPFLDLRPVVFDTIDHEIGDNFIISMQNNCGISRKTLAPKLKQYLMSEIGTV